MMEVQTPPQFDWANNAFVGLNPNMQQPEKWASMQSTAFGIPPTLLTPASIERYGHVTPPEELSPADPHQDARESSIPVEQSRNEALWPKQHLQSQSSTHQDGKPAPKRRRTNRQPAANRRQANNGIPPQQDVNLPPPKRKRGRPISQPQMVEAYAAEGFPSQVSSTRQFHLEKNRVAAQKCRHRKRQYINGLESRAREFSSKNEALKENVAMLREEVLGLKNEVLRHAGCGFWAVDEYLDRCASNLLGMEASLRTPTTRHPSHRSPAVNTNQLMHQRHNSTDTISSQPTVASNPDKDEFGGPELLRDFEDVDMED